MRFYNLVPVNTVASEDGGWSNGARASTVEDEGIVFIIGQWILPSLHTDKILFLKRRSLPPLSELVRPEEKLAGVRIDGKCNCRSRMSYYTGIGIHQLMDDCTLGPEKEIHCLPDGAKINFVTWSNDGLHLSFSVRIDEEDGRLVVLAC